MQLLISALTLLVFGTALPYAQGFTCPVDDCVISQCLYPNIENCRTFWQCSNGRPFLKQCPGGLLYNDFIKVCDWPSSQSCRPGLQPTTQRPTSTTTTVRTTTKLTTTESPATTTTTTTTTQAPISSTASSGFVCPESDIASTGCKGPKDCLYPNPESCLNFIQCTVNADNKTGTPVVMPCAPSNPPLEWNDNKKECDWPSSSTCSGKPASTVQPSTAQPTQAPTQASTAASTAAPEQPSSTAPPSSNVCSEAEIAATSCKGPKDCLYPNPDNCNSFIQCTVNADNKTGTPVVMPCPSGLEWNDNEKICDWPASSTCPNKPQPTAAPTDAPTNAPTNAPTDAPTNAPTNSPTNAQTNARTNAPTTQAPASSTSGPGFVCPVSDIANTGCKGPKDCLYPNPANCNSFIQCTVNADGVTGTPVVMPCPAGLEWNDNDKVCDWPSSSTCNKTSTPASTPASTPSSTVSPSKPTESPSTVPTCDGNDGVDDSNLDLNALCGSDCPLRRLIPNPNSQQRYIECNGGQNNNQNSVKRCSLGLLFDRVNLTCNYAGLVNPYGPNSSN